LEDLRRRERAGSIMDEHDFDIAGERIQAGTYGFRPTGPTVDGADTDERVILRINNGTQLGITARHNHTDIAGNR
jgi:hypothetical protein